MAAKLFMLLLGASPAGRNTEQHDVFFGIGENLHSLIPDIKSFWPEARQKLHIDAWREVTRVDGMKVEVIDKNNSIETASHRLFFINLGGYKKNEFDEFHYKMIIAATDKGEAVRISKNSAFYKHTGFKGATSHIDDKFGVDVDDIYEIADILPASMKEAFTLQLSNSVDDHVDHIHLGYFKLDKLTKFT